MKKLLATLTLVAVLLLASPARSQSSMTPIATIQGAAQTSPLQGQAVTTSGIVTAVRDNGFFLQDPTPDADEATSEGIFVFTQTTPTVEDGAIAVGDEVSVSGTVIEYTPPGQSDSLPLTEISVDAANEIVRISTGNVLPEAIIIGSGGRIPPDRVIDDDSLNTFDPESDGIDFYESLEGMRVQVNDALVVAPTGRFGEAVVVGDRGNNTTNLNEVSGLTIAEGDFNPERIFIQNALGRTPQLLPGAKFEAPLTGVLTYSFGKYELLVTESPFPMATPGVLPPKETTALSKSEDQLTIAALNVENLAPGSDRFDELAAIIVENLQAPDIIALSEVQDNNGGTNDEVVAADRTYEALIEAIANADGAEYEFVDIPPVDDRDGGQPGGNIRVGFIYQPQRVILARAPRGSSTEAVEVVNEDGKVSLSLNPGRIDPDNEAFEDSRKPLVGEFRFNGQSVFVINNHFNSKGGDSPLFGSTQPPQLTSQMQRLQQARVVHAFAEEILNRDPQANVVVLGDLNDFDFSQTIEVLEGDDLENLTDLLPESDRYTFLFRGNFQQLDHILVSQHLLFEGDAEFDIVHVNVGFPDQASDHDPVIARFTLPGMEEETTEIEMKEEAEEPIADTELEIEELEQPQADMDLEMGEEEVTPPSPSLSAIILPALSGSELLDRLAADYRPPERLSYGDARDILYSKVDNEDGFLSGVYTNFRVQVNPNGSRPRSEAFDRGINAEHVWPQSRGASGEAKSDMHNLYPARIEVNSTRGNLPFAEIPDSETDKWLRTDEERTSIPNEAIDEYSEFDSGGFEPREDRKGDVARVMFYFNTVYPDRAQSDFFDRQQAVLCQWNTMDPVDEREVKRSHRIAEFGQGNENPFVLDPTLATRTYCGQ